MLLLSPCGSPPLTTIEIASGADSVVGLVTIDRTDTNAGIAEADLRLVPFKEVGRRSGDGYCFGSGSLHPFCRSHQVDLFFRTLRHAEELSKMAPVVTCSLPVVMVRS